MKTYILPLLLLLTLSSCHKDDSNFIGIHDEWIWVESVGGIAGVRLTPESENLTRKLDIDDFFYREYVNDSLILETEYDLKVVFDSILMQDLMYMDLQFGWRRRIRIDKDEMVLTDLIDDGFYHQYRRL